MVSKMTIPGRPELTQAEVNAFLEKNLAHPELYWRNILQLGMYGRQAEILDAALRFPKVAVAGCNSSMKTFCMTPLTLWELTIYQRHAALEIAPTGHQSAGVFWRDMRGVYGSSRLAQQLLGEAEMHKMRFEVDNYRYASAITPGDEMSIRGFHADNLRFIMDEGNGIQADFFDAISGVAASGNIKIVQLGNPTANSGIFYESCTNPDLGWYTLYISAFDSPNIISLEVPDWFEDEADLPGPIGAEDQRKLAYLEWLNRQVLKKRDRSPLYDIPEYRELMGDVTIHATTRRFVAEAIGEWGKTEHPSWWGRVLGLFPPEAESQFFNRNWIELAASAEQWVEGRGPMVWGIDPAGMGKDEFAVVGVQLDMDPIREDNPRKFRHRIVCWEGFHGEFAMEQAMAFMTPYMSRSMWINVDRLGNERVATELKSWAAQYGVGCWYFTSSLRSTAPTMFKDLKAQAYCHLRDILQMGELSGLTDPLMKRQMLSIHYDANARVTALESKQNMRKRLGNASPDRCDALVYAVFPLFNFVPWQARFGG